MIGGDAQDIALAGLAQRGLDLARAIHAVRRNKRERHLCGDRARDHLARDLGFRRKTHFVRHMRRLQAFGIVRPFLRQIKRPVDEGMAVARHIGGEHADLAIGDLARRARVLARNPARRLALLQKAGLVDDQNRVLIGKRFQRVIAHDVAQRIRVPSPAAQDRLLTPWAGIARRFRAHPARLARLVPQKPVQKLSRRCRNPLLTEQPTHPPFTSRNDDAQSSSVVSIDAPAIHDPPESWWPMDSEVE